MNRRTHDRLARLEEAQPEGVEPEYVTSEEAAAAYRALMDGPRIIVDFPSEPFAAMRAYLRMISQPIRKTRR